MLIAIYQLRAYIVDGITYSLIHLYFLADGQAIKRKNYLPSYTRIWLSKTFDVSTIAFEEELGLISQNIFMQNNN